MIKQPLPPPLIQDGPQKKNWGGGGVSHSEFKKISTCPKSENEKKSLGKSVCIPDMPHIFQHYYTDPKKVDFFPHF